MFGSGWEGERICTRRRLRLASSPSEHRIPIDPSHRQRIVYGLGMLKNSIACRAQKKAVMRLVELPLRARKTKDEGNGTVVSSRDLLFAFVWGDKGEETLSRGLGVCVLKRNGVRTKDGGPFCSICLVLSWRDELKR